MILRLVLGAMAGLSILLSVGIGLVRNAPPAHVRFLP